MAEAEVNPDLAIAEQALKQMQNLDPGSQEKPKNRRRNRGRKQADREPYANTSQNDYAGGEPIQSTNISNESQDVAQDSVQINKSSDNDELKVIETKKRNRPRRARKNNTDSRMLKNPDQIDGDSSSTDMSREDQELSPVSPKPKWSPNNASGPPTPVQPNKNQKKDNTKPIKVKRSNRFGESSPKQRMAKYNQKGQNDKNNSSDPQEGADKQECKGSGGQQQQAKQGSSNQADGERPARKQKNKQQTVTVLGIFRNLSLQLLHESCP